ncbi:hypothetical protein KC19_2G061000 [Ceratodon purpureus]|uniref:Uncharacterized protein n=1 Tax=Ceratodon purpureus TaxID=3225 RepID=A0A8T0ITF5_CERPU|nr:hypothetical protein KC19_2G061000 [Ceratodon purpureus]
MKAEYSYEHILFGLWVLSHDSPAFPCICSLTYSFLVENCVCLFSSVLYGSRFRRSLRLCFHSSHSIAESLSSDQSFKKLQKVSLLQQWASLISLQVGYCDQLFL